MNVNEVISNAPSSWRAARWDQRNRSIPTTTSTCHSLPTTRFPRQCTSQRERVTNALIPAVKTVHDAIAAKAKEFKDVVKSAAPTYRRGSLTFGQEFGGWASLLERDIKRLEQVLDGLYDLPSAETAVGTGLNAPSRIAERAARKLQNSPTSLPLPPQQVRRGFRRTTRSSLPQGAAGNAGCVVHEDFE